MVGIGALAIPGVGPFIAAGPMMTGLAGPAGGAAAGGLTGVLIGMGIPEYEAKSYEERSKTETSCSPLGGLDGAAPITQLPLATGAPRANDWIYKEKWWSRRDLNPRPLRCERSALPAELLPHRRKVILCRNHRFQIGSQPISQVRPFQAEADLRRDEADPIAQVIAGALELVAVELAPLRQARASRR